MTSLAASYTGLYLHFSLNCTTSGSAASEVIWTDGGVLLIPDRPLYETVQILREGITSTYDNLLIFYANNVNEYSGEYGCTVRNALGSSSEVTTIRGKHAEVFVLYNTAIYYTY